MGDLSFIDALVYYRVKFPTLISLGDTAALWQQEYDEVASEALDSSTGTSVSLESGHVSGVVNFSQRHKLRALHFRRAELDVAYVNPYLQDVPEPMPARRISHVVRLGY